MWATFKGATSETIHHHGASLSKQQTADLLTISSWHTAGFVTVNCSIIIHISSEVLPRDKYKYHTCQPFLQPGQVTWLHMHGLKLYTEILS